MTTDDAQTYTVTSNRERRDWHASNPKDAAAQHLAAHPDERIVSVTPLEDLAALQAIAAAATDGPWWWDDFRVPTLNGTSGQAGTYLYETYVLAAEHDGGCGCRATCTLELHINPEDRAYIAAMNPRAALNLIAEVQALRQQVADLQASTTIA